MLLTAAPALAAKTAVYGGAAKMGEPIVLTADAKFQKLRGVTVAAEASCLDGDWVNYAAQLTALKPPAGFPDSPKQLTMKKNAKGVFSGRYVTGWVNDTYVTGVTVTVSGKLKKSTASGTLRVDYAFESRASGELVTTCTSGTERFTASRTPGRIFGGATKQGEPVVFLSDAKHKKIQNFMYSWSSETCNPDTGYFHVPFSSNWHFAILGGKFAGSDTWPEQGANGSKLVFTEKIAGKVGKASASGSISGHVEQFDSSGTSQGTCDSGTLRWTAISG